MRRSILVRPETGVFGSRSYRYLGDDQKRLLARIGTMADAVRPANVLTAAQNPPVATRVLQGTVFLRACGVGS